MGKMTMESMIRKNLKKNKKNGVKEMTMINKRRNKYEHKQK